MLNKKLGIFITLAFILLGCTGQEYKLAQTQKPLVEYEASDRSIEYLILPQDRVDVSLYKDPTQDSSSTGDSELAQSMKTKGLLVNASGYLSLPLIGKIKVAGLTQSQAAEHITQKYKKYLNTPLVEVEVLNKRLYVLGEVKSPGVVQIDKEKMTLFEAIAFAGDLTDDAQRDDIIILSNSTRKGLQMRHIDLTNFDTMRYTSLMLRPNDIVYVQPNGWKEYKVASDNFTAPFQTITQIAAPFVTLQYLSQ